MSGPSAILFDLGGTLLEERRFVLEAGIRAVVGDQPQAIADLTQAFRTELQDHHRVHRELLLSQWLMQRLPLVSDVPINALEDLLWSAIVSHAPVHGVESVLRHLHSDDIPMAVVSNAVFSGRVLSAELERQGMGSFFRFVLSSGDIGCRKPASAIFEEALSRLDVSAAQTWFVGDTFSKDIVGAAAAGLRPVWLSEDDPEASFEFSLRRVRDWGEFMAVYRIARTT